MLQELKDELKQIKPYSRNLKNTINFWQRAKAPREIDYLSLLYNKLLAMDQVKFFIHGQCRALMHLSIELKHLKNHSRELAKIQLEALKTIYRCSKNFMLQIPVFTRALRIKYMRYYTVIHAVLFNQT